ncbi:MAG TPA: hypothetical protein DF699_10995, partial [Phycisphaerales bacterium]|nr:hypothetical protein [Phycisphaerales bacterium]
KPYRYIMCKSPVPPIPGFNARVRAGDSTRCTQFQPVDSQRPCMMRRPRLPQPRLTIPKSCISWGASLLTALWGGFWVWFALMHIFDGQSTAADLLLVALFTLPVLILSILAVVFPRIAGILLIPAAAFGAWFFDDPGARMLLATPALLLGATLIYAGPWRRKKLARLPRRRVRHSQPQ